MTPAHVAVLAYYARARLLGIRGLPRDEADDRAAALACADELCAAGCTDPARLHRAILAPIAEEEWRPPVAVWVRRYRMDGLDVDRLWSRILAASRPVAPLLLAEQPDEAQLRAALQAIGGASAVRDMLAANAAKAKEAAAKAYAAASTGLAVRDSGR